MQSFQIVWSKISVKNLKYSKFTIETPNARIFLDQNDRWLNTFQWEKVMAAKTVEKGEKNPQKLKFVI